MFHRIRFSLLILGLGLLGGCNRTGADDARLQGTWRLNREETIAAAAKQDPKLASPEAVERFRRTLRNLTLTFANGVVGLREGPEEGSRPYRVIERGGDYVVIHTIYYGREEKADVRIHFSSNGASCWMEGWLGGGHPQKFDRVVTEPGAHQ
jgi:FtsP/CotA-like multicopper oxidase with cupredoxin domain